MKKTKRIIKGAAAFLCLCFALLLALNGPTAALAETPEGYPAVRIDPATGMPYDLGGETVYIYDYWSGDAGSDARPDNPTAEQLATYAYHDWLDQTYNCHIVQVQKGDWGTHEQELENFVENSDGTLCVYILAADSLPQAMQNDVIDTWDSSAIDLTDSKWNKNSTGLTEKDGETSTLTPGASEPRQVIFFNKTLLTQAGIDPQSIYTMQKNNTWTWSAFENILSQAQSANVAAITGSADDFYRIAVFANGGSFFDYNDEGNLAITADSANTVEALNWAKRVWSAYAYQPQEGDSWDYYKQAFPEGKAAFYLYQAHGSSEIADIDWGCAAFPIGPSSDAQEYVTIASDNVTVIPKGYIEGIRTKLSVIYDLWTNPTPGYEQQAAINASFAAHGDDDANETYTMLQGSTVTDKTMLLGSLNDITGSEFLWSIDDPDIDVETLIDNNRDRWQALCDRANGIAPPQLAAPVISDITHGTMVGGEFSASISVPEGAAMVYAEFGLVDEDGKIFGWPWEEIYPNLGNRFNVLGFDMLEPGTYRLQAKAWLNDGWEESEQDSEWAVYEFTLADAEIPDISDKVTFSATENIQLGDEITYTVAGADAVTCQMYDEDGEWGTNSPTSYTAGSSASISFHEPGNTHVTIWARYNGVWSMPYNTTVYVEPLGVLDMPQLSWNGNLIGDSLTLRADTPMQFSAYVENADCIYYNIARKAGPGDDDYEWIGYDETDGPNAEFTIDADLLTEGEYQLRVSGYTNGWLHTYKTAQLYLTSRLAAPVFSDITHGATVGGEFSASISIPEGAAWVYAEFGFVDEDGEILGGPWDEIYPNFSNRFTVLGFEMLEPGTYRLQAKAWLNDDWEESEQDSEWAVYEFTLADAELPDISDKVAFSATENIQLGGEITYTVAGADAVTFQMYDEDGEWGTNPPTRYTAGSSASLRFREPGNTHVTIWARYNGVWSMPYNTTIYVEPLGTLDVPYLGWTSNPVGDCLTLSVGTPMQFSAYVNNADYIYYEIYQKNGPDDYAWLDSDSIEGYYAQFTIDAAQMTAGEYRLLVCGFKDGWLHIYKEVELHLLADLAYAVSDGRILSYTGDETVTELVIPNAIDGQQIIAIDEFAFSQCDELTQVMLPAGLQTLDSGAFMHCPLTSVLAPAGTDTQDWYFYEPDASSGQPRAYCVRLPASVTKAEAPFLYTTMPSMAPDYITPTGLETIEAEAFANTAAGFVWLTDSVTAIGDGAFADCADLRFVRIPASCQNIGKNAFDSAAILFVEWGSVAMEYAIQNGYTYVLYAEGFNG